MANQKLFKQDIDIVAMTTTACSKYTSLFRGINFPIVLVEEAAEVFESHIIASLSPNTKHLILIGDHE
jgi:helicase required for RNAi-mediated heterochromatin assembly 1